MTTRYTIAGADGEVVINPIGGNHPLRDEAGSAAAWASWASALGDYDSNFIERRQALGERVLRVDVHTPTTPARHEREGDGPYDDGTQRDAIDG